MPATTLLKMATATAIRLCSQIDSLGQIPYHLARPILLKVQNPQQLRDFELSNPEIAECDAEIWKRFIARDIPDWQNKIIEPKNPANWHKVYAKLQRAEQRKAEEDEENLRRTLQGETLKKATNEALFVAKVLPHKREINTGIVDGVPKSAGNGWGATRALTLRNSKSGKDQIAAIRRQTAMAAKVKMNSQPVMRTTPSQQLNTAKRQITTAPVSMVQDISRARKPLTVAPRDLLPHEQALIRERQAAQAINRIIPAARKGAGSMVQKNRAVEAAAQTARAEKEAKLRALTQTQKPAASSPPAKRFDFLPPPAANDVARRRVEVDLTMNDKTLAEWRAIGMRPAPKAASPPAVKATEDSSDQASQSKPPAAQSTSPQSSPAPAKVVRKRPATSIFAPPIKKRKV